MERKETNETRRTIELKGASIPELLQAAWVEVIQAEGEGWTSNGVDVFTGKVALDSEKVETFAYITMEKSNV